MCGILGGNIRRWNYQKGIERISHRGPDGQKVVEYEDCVLGFARLAIMDLSEDAMQPMVSYDGNVVILFNGEVYGFQALRNRLEKKYYFKTRSDTEVVLYAYMEYGDRFINHIDGMFAIVIYDMRVKQIKIYRDRYGIKPLYYFYKDEKFAFASELKAFVAACGNMEEFKIDKTAIYDYLAYQYIPEPKSMYRDVYKLEPATYIHYDLMGKTIIKKENYWKLKVCMRNHGNKKRRDVLDDIRELIKESVKKQIIADVPVGTFLSGGVDSSIITYECGRIHKGLKSFSIGFREYDYDESKYAKIAAKVCHVENILDVLSDKDIFKVRGILSELYDEPFADTSAYPTYIVAQLAKKDVKVVLTGDGGDEVFGGYERYHSFINKTKKRFIKRNDIERFLVKVRFPGDNIDKWQKAYYESVFMTYCRLIGYFEEDTYAFWKRKLGIADDYDVKWYLRQHYHSDLPAMTRMRYLDFKTYLPSDILTKVDRATMSVSLEARVPFLDRDLVEYVFSLAEDEYFYDGELKTVLKKAYEDIFPKEILYRKKMGFVIPEKNIALGSNTIFERLLKAEWKSLCDGLLYKNMPSKR